MMSYKTLVFSIFLAPTLLSWSVFICMIPTQESGNESITANFPDKGLISKSDLFRWYR